MTGPGGHATPFRAATLAALAAALALRLLFSLGYWSGKPLTHDEQEYLMLGHALATGDGLRYTAEAEALLPHERFGRAPLYPALVGAVEWAGGREAVLTHVRIVQALLGTLAVWLLAGIADRAAGPRSGVYAAWLTAIYPPLVWMPAYVLSESLYVVLAFAAIRVLAAAIDGPGWPEEDGTALRRAAVAGALAGAAVLARPAMLFFLLLVGLVLLWKQRLRTVALLAATSLLVVVPWTIRNYREYHRFVLVASEGGITFWTGNHPLSPGEGDMAANPAIKVESRRLRAAHADRTEEEMESVYYRHALAAIRRDPAWWLGLLGRKLFYTVIPAGPSYTLHSRLYRVASVLSYATVLPFGLVGLIHAVRHGRTPRALLLFAASSVLVCVVFLPQERFRVPAIDSTLLVGAAACADRARARAAAADAR